MLAAGESDPSFPALRSQADFPQLGSWSGRWANMNEPLLFHAVVVCVLALPLSALALVRRKTDGYVYAALAAGCPIFAFGVGGLLGLLDAALFRSHLFGHEAVFPSEPLVSALREHYERLEPAARIALWSGGFAMCVAAVDVGETARQSRGLRRWFGVALIGVALAMFVVTIRTTRLSKSAMRDVIEFDVELALGQGSDGCDALDQAYDAAKEANMPLERDYPRARGLARQCVEHWIARLDSPESKLEARSKADLARAVGARAVPATPAAQLLATSSLPLDAAQRSDLERRAEAER